MSSLKKRILFKKCSKYLISSALLLLIASIVRIYAGFHFTTLVLTIEGLHTLIDFIISLIIIITLILIYSKYAKKFPYGLFKVEDLIALLLAVLILYSAIEVLIESSHSEIHRITGIEPLISQFIAIIFVIFSTLLKNKASKVLNSPSLKADVMHTLIDILESSIVLIGLILYFFFFNNIIYIIILVISSIGLFMTAYEVGKDSLLALLDIPKDKRLAEKIKQEIHSHYKNIKITDMKIRWAGSVIFVELTIRVHPLLTIEDSYVLIRKITNFILSKYSDIEDIVVKVEPTKRENVVIAFPQDELGLEKTPFNTFW